MAEKPKLYVYKMTVDNGGAPCVYRGLLTLAICKPEIRQTAEVGSFVFGFGGKKYEERLIYVAVVEKKLMSGDYYRQPRYSRRPDCIYNLRDGKTAELKKEAKYHTKFDERHRDIGKDLKRANVLLSDDFRYFGKNGTTAYQDTCPAIGKLVKSLKQGHRVNHSEELYRELSDLQRRLWKRRVKKQGEPTESDLSKPCNRGGSAECSKQG